uniref:THAP-type domain-containing protein n=1 Tax=Ditylenchus dipsaci TaxID=166011 RepID=A0A915ET90_9BILA
MVCPVCHRKAGRDARLALYLSIRDQNHVLVGQRVVVCFKHFSKDKLIRPNNFIVGVEPGAQIIDSLESSPVPANEADDVQTEQQSAALIIPDEVGDKSKLRK